MISDLVRDLAKIEYIINKPSDFGAVGYEIVRTVPSAQHLLDVFNPEFLANDIETKYVDDKYVDDIRSLAISDGSVVNTYVFPEPVAEQLVWPVDRRWTFHNGMFDTRVIMSDFGVELPIVEDTLLMSYSLDERGGSVDESPVEIAVGIHGLKRLAREYCGSGFYDVDTKSVPDPILWEYNAKDAAYTARLANYFYQRQLAEDVRGVYEELTLPQAPLCRDEYVHGVYVHRDLLQEVALGWTEEWLRLDDELKEEVKQYGWPDEDFNFNSHPQLKKFLNNYLHLAVPNTQADTLKDYSGHPFVKKYQRIKKIDKQLSTYVIGTADVLYRDGRVRPEPSIHGTTSGRLNYHKPPIGTIPTGSQYVDPDQEPDEETALEIAEFSRIRGLFGAPKGSVLIEADYEAAELWTAAFLSQDDVMLADLLTGDFHSQASETMFGVRRTDFAPNHWKAIRRESKYVTFGVLYWRTAFSLFDPKAGQGGNLGKKYTLKQLEDMVKAWHQRYIGHLRWSQEEVRQARQSGQQRSITGRLRRYHAPALYGKHFANMAVNFPVQATSHDHLIKARLDLGSAFNLGESPARTLWDGHDAIFFECPIPNVREALPIIKELMERPRWFERGLPVEIKVGTSWANAKVVPSDQFDTWEYTY